MGTDPANVSVRQEGAGWPPEFSLRPGTRGRRAVSGCVGLWEDSFLVSAVIKGNERPAYPLCLGKCLPP